MKNVLSVLRRPNNKIYRAAVIAASVVVFFSCTAVPEKAEMPSSVGLLPESVNILISTRVAGGRELIEPVLDVMGDSIPSELSEDFLKLTDMIWAGLELTESGEYKSSIAAVGDYPKGLIEWGLWWDADWNKVSFNPLPEGNYELDYWDDKLSENQVALPSVDYLLASGGDIKEMLETWAGGGVPSSAEWNNAEAGADITIMTRGLTQEEYSMFVPDLKKVPIESLVLSLKRVGDDYLISGTFHMDSAVNSYLFATIFRTLVITAKTPEGKRQFTDLKEIKIEKDGTDVVLYGMKLPVERVAEIEKEWLGLAGIE